MNLLRFSTAGSVDDGKSTLIGRLLYDAKSIFEDQYANLVRTTARRGGVGGNVDAVMDDGVAVDLALLTDGLVAEREQGITIDVAYRYFATPARKFIIADTPGHEQYTRNMVTGASTADCTIVLVDAKKGVLPQSRRHAAIAALLGIRHVVFAVNKMDLVDDRQDRFDALRLELEAIAAKLGLRDVVTIPMSALRGDMVVERGDRLDWYRGPTLLRHLETIDVSPRDGRPLRFPVQLVSRPGLPGAYVRGYMGRIESGTVRVGDRVVALPSGRTTTVADIVTLDGSLPSRVGAALGDAAARRRAGRVARRPDRARRRGARAVEAFRRDAVLDGRRAAEAERPLSRQAHDADDEGDRRGRRRPPRHRDARVGRCRRRRARDERDRPRAAARARAADARRVRRRAGHRVVHPHRRGDEPHRRGRHGRASMSRRTHAARGPFGGPGPWSKPRCRRG